MPLTEEQQSIIDTIKLDSTKLLLVNSVSGSGKSTMIAEAARAVNARNGLYLAYNKAIANEMDGKMPSGITCSTTHSLAYQNTVRPMGLKIGFMSYRTIRERMPFEQKILIVEKMKLFCLSKYTSLDSYIMEENISHEVGGYMKLYLGKMKNRKIDSTHEFYMKLYHILLANKTIKHNEFDFVALDEFGDINPVTLEIFRLLPAKKKIAVGDQYQNIYQFNNTINGFVEMSEEGIHKAMTMSFRVSNVIAKRVELFCQKHVDTSMSFKGQEYTENQKRVVSSAFIARTNSALISEMIKLNELGTEYGLVRKAKHIFELPLGIMNLATRGSIGLAQYKFLDDDYRDWNSSLIIKRRYPSIYGYLMHLHQDDIAIKTALKLLVKNGPKAVYDTFALAKSHENKDNKHLLMTAHSSKGLEIDSVYIADDMNDKVNKVINEADGDYDEDDLCELNLYYVSCTRARYEVHNAKLL